MSSKEDILHSLAQPPSASEQERIERTKRMISDAMTRSADERVKAATVFAKGSVKANTNIRRESDIDICVMPKDIFFCYYPSGASHSAYGNKNANYSYSEFRSEVTKTLKEAFGYRDVEVGNMALKIRSTVSDSRIDADVVPAFEHRRYTSLESDHYHSGIEFYAQKTGDRVINWPSQNYDNTLWKHENTGRRHRKMVRILKRLRETMPAKDYASADVPSFLIESLVWNAPNKLFGNDYYYNDLANILIHLIRHTAASDLCSEWGEVNELKYLFNPSQKWTREQAHSFLVDASDYLENHL